jgi:predicted nucleic acid-binding protein
LILDTNVLSALMLEPAEPIVLDWLSDQDPETMFTTTICQAEIRLGIAMLPEGRRRARLQVAADGLFEDGFAGRVLSFDAARDQLLAALTPPRECPTP